MLLSDRPSSEYDMSPRGVRIATGALLGLAWGAGFRAYMSELAGEASKFNWAGTFGAILVPSALSGAALGLAQDLRRNGGAPTPRRSPLPSRRSCCQVPFPCS